MKKAIIYLLVFNIIAYKSFCQQKIRIISSQENIEYLQNKPGIESFQNRDLKVKLEYWSDKTTGNTDQEVKFNIASGTAAPNSKPEINMSSPIIPADSFTSKHDTMTFIVHVKITAIKSFTPEFFTIGLDGLDASTGGALGVTIQKNPIETPINPTPGELTFLNAMNFDFDGSGGSSYVGHLNIFKPDAFRSKGKHKLGLNLGIMKINFSRNDSLNKSYDYFENVLIHPLDSIKSGMKILRQFNKLTTASKNITWGFYFQPTYSIIYSEKFKLLFHVHTELFIDKWTTNTTISNYQQDSAVITSDNISVLRDSIGILNKFYKSTAELITSSSTSTTLNFTFGLGLTLHVSLWDGASLFIQPTIGWAFDYARPLSINNKNLTYNSTVKENIHAHLTRFILKQNLTTNLQAVIGIDVRGKFGRDPTYAAYIGANIGLSGLKKMLN